MRTTTLGTPGASSDLPFHPVLRHPLTGEPLQAIGLGRCGPIWPILGGAPDEGGDSDGDGTDTSGGTDSGQQQDKQTDGGDGGTDSSQDTSTTKDDKAGDGKKPEPKDVKDFPSAAQKMIRDLRKEAGDNRGGKSAAEAALQKLKDDFAVALGLKKGEDVDPAKLQEQLTADVAKANGERDEARLELAVFRSADKHGADPSALLDSRDFLKDVGELDAADKNFPEDLAGLIKQRVKDNPTRYGREAPKAKKSGSEHMTGGTSTERTGSLHAAVAKTMTRT